MTYPVNEWSAEGAAVFRIIKTGRLTFRGEPEVTNEFYLRVYPGVGVATEADAEKVAQRIAALLNSSSE
jgi:hypothetical protein